MDGLGYHKWPDGDIYWGEYKNEKKWGDGVFKEKGVLYRDKYEEGKRISRSQIS
jgi:hypothetical protein